jgi:predicted nucleic acid-binding protein
LAGNVSAESNWIVDVALGRNVGASRMWRLAQEGQLTIHLPSFSTAESVKVIENMQRRWRELSQRLAYERNEFGRASLATFELDSLSEAGNLLDSAEDSMEILLWDALEQLSDHIRFIEFDRSVIRRTREIRVQLEGSPADAVVLATVLEAHERYGCEAFVSRDRAAFSKAATVEFLTAKGITYYPNPADYLRAASLR